VALGQNEAGRAKRKDPPALIYFYLEEGEGQKGSTVGEALVGQTRMVQQRRPAPESGNGPGRNGKQAAAACHKLGGGKRERKSCRGTGELWGGVKGGENLAGLKSGVVGRGGW